MQPVVARSRVEDYRWPSSVADAHGLLQELGASARVVGGGTDLALHPPSGVQTLVDLSRLGLSYLHSDEGTVVVGAASTLAAMEHHPALAEYGGGVLIQVLTSVGSPALRNVATIGGHLARGRLSDLVPALLVLDAEVRLFDGDVATMTLDDFYRDGWHRRSIIVTELRLPASAARRATGFVKFSRGAFDFATLNVAAALDLTGDRVEDARLAVGETPWLAQRVPDVERALIGKSSTDETIGMAAALAREVIRTGTDMRATAEYRSRLIEVGVRRCLRATVGRPEIEP